MLASRVCRRCVAPAVEQQAPYPGPSRRECRRGPPVLPARVLLAASALPSPSGPTSARDVTAALCQRKCWAYEQLEKAEPSRARHAKAVTQPVATSRSGCQLVEVVVLLDGRGLRTAAPNSRQLCSQLDLSRLAPRSNECQVKLERCADYANEPASMTRDLTPSHSRPRSPSLARRSLLQDKSAQRGVTTSGSSRTSHSEN